MNDWEQYGFDPFKDSHGDDRVKQFDLARHVTHVDDAREVIKAGTLRAAPVLDRDLPFESVTLKAVWFSANTWGNGSIFGNVEFGTPWQALVAERKFYWLGVRERNLTAFRFLLTSDESIPNEIGLERYDPMTDAGPLQ